MTGNIRNESIHLIQRFLASYNNIDDKLRQEFKVPNYITFSELMITYGERFPTRAKDIPFIKTCAKLRNILVHDQKAPYHYPAIPSAWMVEKFDTIANSIQNPKRVLPAYKCNVSKLQIDQKLTNVLELIRNKGYSQFPVYDGNQLRGLLTENGITRWLAEYVRKESIFDFEDIIVKEAFSKEEDRVDYEFVNSETLIDDVFYKFSANPNLEAVFISPGGNTTEDPLGIITRWNIFQERNVNSY